MLRLDEILKDKKTVGIAGHINPDGDCVGSCLAVYNYIRTYHKDIDVQVYLDPFPTIFCFLTGSDTIIAADGSEKAFDLFIALDCGDARRLGNSAPYFAASLHTLCVDHHLSNDSFAETNYIFPHKSSTCELVMELVDEEKITKEIAECLYTGMMTDTGVFKYSSTTSETMRKAGVLMDTGIDFGRMIDDVFYAKTYHQNQIMGQALLKAKLHEGGQIISSVIEKEEMERFEVLPKHMEGIAEQLRLTTGVVVAIFLYDNGKGYKVSTRANGEKVNLAALAQKYDGGGHAKAAGFSVVGDPNEAIERIVADIKELL
ncbi:MAG: bifunctional oligoribonuclease/PAP phosphatase NrnA [Lachnospiraceae bacterium]|nr:bifunctional oligoribonuclease/PAP phosphatase NrnA [Lachnospiraceae bacterium]